MSCVLLSQSCWVKNNPSVSLKENKPGELGQGSAGEEEEKEEKEEENVEEVEEEFSV